MIAIPIVIFVILFLVVGWALFDAWNNRPTSTLTMGWNMEMLQVGDTIEVEGDKFRIVAINGNVLTLRKRLWQ